MNLGNNTLNAMQVSIAVDEVLPAMDILEKLFAKFA